MNLYSKIICSICIISGVFTGIFSQDCKSRVKLLTDTGDIKVFIDQEEISNTDSIYLSNGIYVFEAYENTGKWNPKIFTDTVIIKNCDTLSLHYNFKPEQLIIESNPSDAKVYANDSLIGYTPLHLSSNFENLLLKKKNYADKIVSANQMKKSEPVELEFIGNGPNNKFYGSTKFIILAGTAVVLGAATAYYKLKADKKFDEYQVTGDPALLDETDKFDLISGITFSALQINFGAIIYFFFTE